MHSSDSGTAAAMVALQLVRLLAHELAAILGECEGELVGVVGAQVTTTLAEYKLGK